LTPIVFLFLAAKAKAIQAFSMQPKLRRARALASFLIRPISHLSEVQITQRLKCWIRDKKSYNIEESQSKKIEESMFIS